jgi:hypothetical protein
MLMNRLAGNSVPTEAPLAMHVPAPPGTPVLRTCLRAALTVPLQHGMNLGAIFQLAPVGSSEGPGKEQLSSTTYTGKG